MYGLPKGLIYPPTQDASHHQEDIITINLHLWLLLGGRSDLHQILRLGLSSLRLPCPRWESSLRKGLQNDATKKTCPTTILIYTYICIDIYNYIIYMIYIWYIYIHIHIKYTQIYKTAPHPPGTTQISSHQGTISALIKSCCNSSTSRSSASGLGSFRKGESQGLPSWGLFMESDHTNLIVK